MSAVPSIPVQFAMDRWGAGCLEPVRVADDPVGHETAIGPAANAQTGGIDVRPAGQAPSKKAMIS